MDIPIQKNAKEEAEALRLVALAGDKQKEIKLLEAQIKEKQATFLATTQALNNEERRLKEKKQDVATLETRETELSESTKSLQETMTRLEQEKQRSEELCLVAQNDLSSWQTQVAREKAALGSLKREQTEFMHTKAQEQENATKTHEALMAELEETLTQKRSEVSALELRAEHTQKNLDKLNELTRLNQENLDNFSASRQAILDMSLTELDRVVESMKKAEADLAAANKAKSTAEQETNDLRLEKAILLAELSKARSDFEYAKEQTNLKLGEVRSAKHTALIEINTAMTQARLKETTDQLASAINSISND